VKLPVSEIKVDDGVMFFQCGCECQVPMKTVQMVGDGRDVSSVWSKMIRISSMYHR
jgi:hypothetical protein